MSSSLRVCILGGPDAGGGSTVAAVMSFIRQGYVTNTEIACVITTNFRAGVLRKAKIRGLTNHQLHTLPRDRYPHDADVDAAILAICERHSANAIWQSGWLRRTGVPVIKKFAGRIWNQHPGALNPNSMQYDGHRMDFGGKGMHGIVPVAAALYYAQASKTPSAKYARATAHMLTEHEEDIDGGKVIGERLVPILNHDTPEALQGRLKPAEQFLHANMMAHLASYGSFFHFQPAPIVTCPEDAGHLKAARIRALETYGSKK